MPEQANILRLFVGTVTSPAASDRVWVLETNLDDLPGEVVGYTMTRLMEAGALDAFVTPIQMKKNRPGVMVSVLCDEAKIPALEDLLFRETAHAGHPPLSGEPPQVQEAGHRGRDAVGPDSRQARLARRPAADVQSGVRRLCSDRRGSVRPAPRGLRRRPRRLCTKEHCADGRRARSPVIQRERSRNRVSSEKGDRKTETVADFKTDSRKLVSLSSKEGPIDAAGILARVDRRRGVPALGDRGLSPGVGDRYHRRSRFEELMELKMAQVAAELR